MPRQLLGTIIFISLGVMSAEAQEAPFFLEQDAPADYLEEDMAAEEAEGFFAIPDRLWFNADYLYWWNKNGPTPGPLVTTGSAGAARPGALGQPGTAVLFGDSGVDYQGHSGVRLTLGSWLDRDQTVGLEASSFVLESHTFHYKIDSDRGGSPVIARPFFNVLSGAEDAQVITLPGSFFGGIDVFSDSRLWGAEANLIGSGRGGVEWLAGMRFANLKEDIRVSQSSTLLAPGPGFFGVPVPPPEIVSVTDRFDTINQFYGGQIGARGSLWFGRGAVRVSSKMALGSTYQAVNIRGVTSRTGSDGITFTGPGGLLALETNSGLTSRNHFSYISETTAHLGYQITNRLLIQLGYTFFYWNGVARPGAQMNRTLNPRQIPTSLPFGPPVTPPQPVRFFNSSDYWAQGVESGLEFRY